MTHIQTNSCLCSDILISRRIQYVGTNRYFTAFNAFLRVVCIDILSVLFLVFSSCGHGSKESAEESANNDSIWIEQARLKKLREDSIRKAREDSIALTTTSGQLDFMKKSEHWNHYSTGILPQMAEEVPIVL